MTSTLSRSVGTQALLSRILERFHMGLQRIDLEGKWLSRFIDRQNSRWLRLAPKVCKGALALAREAGADVVICGHTHHAAQSEHDRIQYFNSGCWTGWHAPTFITVSEAGPQLHEFTGGELSSDDDLLQHDEEYFLRESGAA